MHFNIILNQFSWEIFGFSVLQNRKEFWGLSGIFEFIYQSSRNYSSSFRTTNRNLQDYWRIFREVVRWFLVAAHYRGVDTPILDQGQLVAEIKPETNPNMSDVPMWAHGSTISCYSENDSNSNREFIFYRRHEGENCYVLLRRLLILQLPFVKTEATAKKTPIQIGSLFFTDDMKEKTVTYSGKTNSSY